MLAGRFGKDGRVSDDKARPDPGDALEEFDVLEDDDDDSDDVSLDDIADVATDDED